MEFAAAVAAGADAAAAAGPAAAGAGVAAGVAVAAAGADADPAAAAAACCCAANHGDGALPRDGSVDAPGAVVGVFVGGCCGGGGGSCTELDAAAPCCDTEVFVGCIGCAGPHADCICAGLKTCVLQVHCGHCLHILQTQLVQTRYPYSKFLFPSRTPISR